MVPLDKQADVMIVDHARKEALPGSHVLDQIFAQRKTDYPVDTPTHLSKSLSAMEC